MRYDVVVIGDVFYDIMTSPLEDYPERDTQVGVEFLTSLGGQAGNCAAACASLGLRTALICKVGSDELSSLLLRVLEGYGVECFTSVSERFRSPGITVSITFRDGSRTMLSYRGANLDLRHEDVDYDVLRRARFLMRAGHWNTPSLFAANRRILGFARRECGVPTALDIGWSAYLGWGEDARNSVLELLPETEFLFVNERELKALAGASDVRSCVRRLLDSGCENVVLHLGERGSAWLSEDLEVRVGAFRAEVRRPTGAGDAFNAGFIFAFLRGKSPEDCLRFANACGAVHLQKERGYPTLEEVKALLGE
ncbi:MAG: carbohydrate kinase family protein [Candidatus Alkanophagales archaeon]